MDKRLKNRWIKALLSGKFKQGLHGLRNSDNTYCCLGVLLCKVDKDSWKFSKRLNKWKHHMQERDDEFINRKTLKLIGMTDNQQNTLASMNDDGYSFKNIAKWIKENL